jgi:signal transduction histidine kinase/ActR/RegA family two-component response regulator
MMEGRELKAGRLIHADTGRYMFDDQMLRRFGLDRNRLPPESILINEPDTFYKHYYRQIWAFTVLVSALLALVAGLLWINSKLRTARETLLAAKRAAEDASQMKSRFLANMSHEIRTPLGAVLGFAELLTASDLSPAQRNELIEKIKRHGVILTNVVNDILDFSRAESGRLQIERIKIDLRELLSDVLSAPTLIAKEKGLRLGISSEGPIPRFIMSDPTRLKQILSNLIGNAIKFTNQGSVECHIKFQPTPLQATSPETKNRIIFFVRDTGRGLSEKEAAGLFMPFIQADTSTTRKYGGTGLGLALARDLARALGGDVRLIDYAEGRGCTFEASIEAGACGGEWTLHDVADLEAVTAASPSTSTLPTTQLTGLKVLLAEDSADNQLFVSRFLRKAGAEVDIVENGAEAIEAALNGDHDLILMDIQMPILDGIEATKELRQKGYRKPIVALTAHALADQRQRTHDAGCNYHLTKPVNRDELMQTVARLTGGDHGEGP